MKNKKHQKNVTPVNKTINNDESKLNMNTQEDFVNFLSGILNDYKNDVSCYGEVIDATHDSADHPHVYSANINPNYLPQLPVPDNSSYKDGRNVDYWSESDDQKEENLMIGEYARDIYDNGISGVNNAARDMSSEELYRTPVCYPNQCQIDWEIDTFDQFGSGSMNGFVIDNIRRNNAVMADIMAEQYRRQLAAMFEYNLQANLQMANAVKVMCTRINNDNDDRR
jgi:hypothetical protein